MTPKPGWIPIVAAALSAFGPTAPIPVRHGRQTAIDSVRLMTDLSILAHDSMQGRRPGTEGSERARRFIVASLDHAVVPPLGEGYAHPFAWSGGEGVNLLGLIPGRERPDRYIVLTAHYDHEGIVRGDIYNGADDNASGTAAVLEIARMVVERPLANSLLVALVDAEEEGLRGSRAFVARPPVPLDRVELNVNLDMVSRTAGLLWASGAAHTPALEPTLEAVKPSGALTLRLGHDRPGALEGDDWTNSSDHAPFHRAGVPYVYFGVEDHADYHRPSDDFDRVDPGEYLAAVRTIYRALRALDAALPLDEGSR
jgi:Zn-dependent M28 family amino/carboxypeptidase